jgi:hypothetical protein
MLKPTISQFREIHLFQLFVALFRTWSNRDSLKAQRIDRTPSMNVLSQALDA